jgi:hypothetical protein
MKLAKAALVLMAVIALQLVPMDAGSAPPAAALAASHGRISFSLQFETAGEFPPQTNPHTSYYTPSQDPIAEHDGFPAVSGGVLQQRMANLAQPNNGLSRYQSYPGQMDSRLPFFMEVRLKTLVVGDDGHLCFFSRDDVIGARNFEVAFNSGGVELADGTTVAVDHSVMHTYRIEAPGGTSTYKLLIDGQQVATGVASVVTTGENAFAFGDSEDGGLGWDVDYDYVLFQQGTAPVSVPALGTAGKLAAATMLMGVGVSILFRRRGRLGTRARG